jgi:hypothetical protein
MRMDQSKAIKKMFPPHSSIPIRRATPSFDMARIEKATFLLTSIISWKYHFWIADSIFLTVKGGP